MEHILLEALKLLGQSVNIEYAKKIMLSSSDSHVDIDVDKLVDDINILIKRIKEKKEKEYDNIVVKKYKKMNIDGKEYNIPMVDPKDIPDSWWESDSEEQNMLT